MEPKEEFLHGQIKLPKNNSLRQSNQAHKIFFILAVQPNDFFLVRLGAKLSTNISLKAWSGSTEPTNFATMVALSLMCSKSSDSDHKRWAKCNLLFFELKRIPQLLYRFSLSDFDSFFCICLLNICLSPLRYLLLLAKGTHCRFCNYTKV